MGGRPLDDPTVLEGTRGVARRQPRRRCGLEEERDGERQVRGDPSGRRFPRRRGEVARAARGRRGRFKRRGEVPFTYERRLMGTLQEDLAGELGIAVVTKGAPEALLARCTSERVAEVVRPLAEARREELLAAVARLAEERAPPARRRLQAASREPHRRGRRVTRAGACLPGSRRNDRPTQAGSAGGNLRMRGRRHPRAHDHGRPRANGRTNRNGPRHRRARCAGCDRGGAGGAKRGRPRGSGARFVPSSRASRPRTSSRSSQRSRPTSRSLR